MLYVLLCLPLLVMPVQADELDNLIASARHLQLAADPDWLNLLHYKSHVFTGVYSQADDGEFFLASNGKENAEAELIATLHALFNNKETQCRFPARLYWLNSQLNFQQQLPVADCHEFNQWKNKLAVADVTLIFPSMYLNNPASMFGHTFLRLDQRNQPALLDYTLSYAARSDADDSAFEYVYKGLSGGYAGVFAVQPYFETVQSYGDIEHRDIWEFSLNLNQAEVDQLMRHVWEIRGIQFDYYFLRENCSYRLLSLLDVARPGVNMTQQHQFPVYAAPVDTVRAMIDAGFVENKHYRPAISSRIQQMYQQLNSSARTEVFNLVDNRQSLQFEHFKQYEQAQILELAQEINEFKKQDTDHYLLSARSRLDFGDRPTFEFKNISADQGHDTARWSVAYGEENNQSFVELGIRPVFHDLLDKADGFVRGAAISVLDTRLRWFDEQQKFQLQQLNIFELISLSPIEKWMTPLSVRLDISVQQQTVNNIDDAYIMSVDSGMGLSAGWGRSIVYLLADLAVEYSGYYEKNYKVYLGAEIGAVIPFEASRLLLGVQSLNGISGDKDSRDHYQMGYQFDLDKNHAIRFVYEKVEYDRQENKSLDVKYLLYF